MARTEPCKKCGKQIDTRGLKAHEKNCKVIPKPKAVPESPPKVEAKPPEKPPEPIQEKQVAQPETIVIKQDYTDVPALPGEQQVQPETKDTPAPVSPVFTGGKADLFDFDEQDCAYAYGALMETGALLLAGAEVSFPEDRAKKQGAALRHIMLKYNLSFKYMDLCFFGVGVAGDIAYVVREINAKKPKEETKKVLETDGTKHEIVEQTKAPDKPTSLLKAGSVKAP